MVRLPFKVSNAHDLKFTGSFMKDNEDNGHMKVSKFVDSLRCYFLLQHGLKNRINPENPKFRSVFNGSAEDLNKLSINSILHTRANLLPDLPELLANWRKYKFVFVSDTEQMFRQILVHPDGQRFQQILWRYSLYDEIEAY